MSEQFSGSPTDIGQYVIGAALRLASSLDLLLDNPGNSIPSLAHDDPHDREGRK